jgi:hypothetical protein
MKALVSVLAAGFCLSMWAVSPARAGDIPALGQYPLGAAPNRLDIYDLRREYAREAEHRRIRTRLGDPDLGCRPSLMDRQVEIVTPGAGVVVIVCR